MILVTGATGLLGAHILSELTAHGYTVRAMYRDKARIERVRSVMQYYSGEKSGSYFDQVEWVEGDVLDLVQLEEVMTGCEKVIHCAALVSFHRRDFSRLFEQNRQGTANVVNTALHLGIKQLVHISSTAAIGSDTEYTDGLKRESNHWHPNERASGYALSKYSAEKEVWRGIEEGLNAVMINPSILFGPGNWEESSLKIMRTLHGGLRFYTPGANAFVDVRDVATVVRLVMEAEITGERFLVTGHNLGYKELFGIISEKLKVKGPTIPAGKMLTGLAWRMAGIWGRLVGKRPTITRESARSSQHISRFSTEKLMKQFPGFSFHSIEDTIDNTIKGRQTS